MSFDATYTALVSFRIRSFADACLAIAEDPTADKLSFLEKISLAVEAEVTTRHDRRVARCNKEARFLDPVACIEDITYLPNRTLSRDTIVRLATGDYIDAGHNIVVTSTTGCGKSYLICALGNAACRQGRSVRYIRHADLCRRLDIARRTEEHYEVIQEMQETTLLILDDLFLEEASMITTTDLFEIIAYREAARLPIIIASQLSYEQWHLRIDTKVIADALLDRVVHNSYTINIEGPNMREYFAAKKAL